jgi:hypothetical protein
MKKIHFKFLFYKHSFLQFLGITRTDIIKIWQDEETQDTCLYLKGRRGFWYMHLPVGRECEENKKVYSNWIASVAHMSKYGLLNDKRNKATIYTLISVKERD